MSETPRRIKVERKDIISLTPVASGRRPNTAGNVVKSHFSGIDVRAPIVIEFGSRWTKFVYYIFV